MRREIVAAHGLRRSWCSAPWHLPNQFRTTDPDAAIARAMAANQAGRRAAGAPGPSPASTSPPSARTRSRLRIRERNAAPGAGATFPIELGGKRQRRIDPFARHGGVANREIDKLVIDLRDRVRRAYYALGPRIARSPSPTKSAPRPARAGRGECAFQAGDVPRLTCCRPNSRPRSRKRSGGAAWRSPSRGGGTQRCSRSRRSPLVVNDDLAGGTIPSSMRPSRWPPSRIPI